MLFLFLLLFIKNSTSYLLPMSSNTPKILFFTGGNSLMPVDIYSDFISKLKTDYEVYTIKNYFQDNKNSIKLIEQLFDYSGEKEIIPIGHSSGCTTLLNYCSKLNNVKKCVLLDPVNNNLDNNNNIKFDKILQINAEKSYKWKINRGINFIKNPIPKIPFIPAFSMNIKDMYSNINVTNIEVKNFGHCDILDTAFSNIMHNSVAEGNNERDSLNKYKDLIIELIYMYINDNTYTIEKMKEHNKKFNIEYSVN